MAINQNFYRYKNFCKQWILECLLLSLLFFIVIMGVYILAMKLNEHLVGIPYGIDNDGYLKISTSFDKWVPFVKEFALPYLLAYPFWFIAPFMIYGFMGRKIFYRFIVMSIVFALLSFVVFICFPNGVHNAFLGDHINRHSKNFFDQLCVMIIDGEKNQMGCAFPSGHWGNSILIAIIFRTALFDKTATSTKRTIAWIVYLNAILICLSTLFIKQHYVLDGVIAITLCELAWFISRRNDSFNQKIERAFHTWNNRLKISTDTKVVHFKKGRSYIANWILWIFLALILCVGIYFTTFTLAQLGVTFFYFIVWMLGILIYYLFPFDTSKNYIDANTRELKFK